jgi:hypothetical protein
VPGSVTQKDANVHAEIGRLHAQVAMGGATIPMRP